MKQRENTTRAYVYARLCDRARRRRAWPWSAAAAVARALRAPHLTTPAEGGTSR